MVARAVGRRLVPALIEATLVPTLLFYVALAATGELLWALLAVAGWSYAAVARRLIGRRGIPTILLLASLGVTVRTVVFALSGNAVVYFAQPIAGATVTATAFGVSALVSRPLVGRFADDFCAMSSDVRDRPAISGLYRRLTLLWAGINLTAAAISVALLLTVPVAVFVGTRTVAMWMLTCTGVLVTVSASVRVARTEGLVTAVGPNGALRAFVHPAS